MQYSHVMSFQKWSRYQNYVFLYTKIKYYSKWILWQNVSFTMNVKTSNYYGTYMQVLQEMPKKLAAIMETICGYSNEWRMSTIICALYVGIARNAKCQRLLWDSYAGIARNVKGQRLLWDLYAGIAINAKCLCLFLRLYAGIAY
jgi:hypothetical protein